MNNIDNMNYNISFSNIIYETKTGNLHPTRLKDIFRRIYYGDEMLSTRIGNLTLAEATEIIRNTPDHERQNYLKEHLMPVVFYNGVFEQGTNSGLVSYSNVTALDFDNITSQAESDKVWRDLQDIPSVIAIFHTFKPFRLKAIVVHDNPYPARHKDMYKSMMSDFGLQLLDPKCSDLSRRNFLVYDPNIIVREDFNNLIPYHFEPKQSRSEVVTKAPTCVETYSNTYSGKPLSARSIISILMNHWRNENPEYWNTGNRSNSIFLCAVQLCRYGVPKDITEERFLQSWLPTGIDGEEIRKQIDGAYKKEQHSFGKYPFYSKG